MQVVVLNEPNLFEKYPQVVKLGWFFHNFFEVKREQYLKPPPSKGFLNLGS